MLQIGDQFDHFEIRSYMAQGGMADIYRAYDLMSGKEVVIKVPNKMMLGDPAEYERFQRELEVTNALHHPAIQKGLGSGRFNRTPYLVTELVEGQSLRDMLTENAPFPPETAVEITRKIAEAMDYCHQNNVIHRDLKPENILISTEGQPVILDFGLALTKAGRRVTYANLSATMGTPDYMAPEQIEGQRGDQRTDIYSVGTMLYEMLAGRLPFTGESYQAVVAQHLQASIPRLDHVKPDVSPQLAAICAKCLQRNLNDRYPNMQALITDLNDPSGVDLAILEKGTGAQTALPFWKTPEVRSVLFAILLIVVIVMVAAVTQGLR